jgi:hypothetical protein
MGAPSYQRRLLLSNRRTGSHAPCLAEERASVTGQGTPEDLQRVLGRQSGVSVHEIKLMFEITTLQGITMILAGPRVSSKLMRPQRPRCEILPVEL